MPTLDWIGKKAVVNHHRKVPFRLLQECPELSFGDSAAGNLLVQGDNLLALKALLPYYAGKVKCIYIDPPYNTGNERWIYNDNLNSPEIKTWLGKVVGSEAEDLSRHDKWLCMMYPRLALLREFLSRDGIIAVSIDDNELNYLGALLDEFFSPRNRLACAPWLAEPSGGKEKTGLRGGHEYLFIYHNGDDTSITRESRSVGALNLTDKWGKYRKGRELRKWGGISRRSDRPGQWFALRAPDGTEVWPIRNDGEEGHWRWGKNQLMKPILEDSDHAHWEIRPFDEGVTWQGKTERWVPYEKIRDSKKAIGWSTWLDHHGFNADATRELKALFGKKNFETPKPSLLLRWLFSLHGDENALILDSFAGSGTAGHAALSLNHEDGGARRFILVEMDPAICREVAAERLKRVISGYGEQEPLGGGFRYCTLGEPLFDEVGNIRKTVTFSDLAAHVFFTETGAPVPQPVDTSSPFLGARSGKAVYLLFNGVLGDRRPAGGNVLTGDVLQRLSQFDGVRVVYGEGCRLGADRLRREGVVFRQIPYEIKVS
jgi:adenine-specific DNA-methyltransferase